MSVYCRLHTQKMRCLAKSLPLRCWYDHVLSCSPIFWPYHDKKLLTDFSSKPICHWKATRCNMVSIYFFTGQKHNSNHESIYNSGSTFFLGIYCQISEFNSAAHRSRVIGAHPTTYQDLCPATLKLCYIAVKYYCRRQSIDWASLRPPKQCHGLPAAPEAALLWKRFRSEPTVKLDAMSAIFGRLRIYSIDMSVMSAFLRRYIFMI